MKKIEYHRVYTRGYMAGKEWAKLRQKTRQQEIIELCLSGLFGALFTLLIWVMQIWRG